MTPLLGISTTFLLLGYFNLVATVAAIASYDSGMSVGLAERSVDHDGNGITFPTTMIPLVQGQSYVCTFVTGSPVQWGTISIDLYNVADDEYFLTNIARIDASQALNPINPLTGSIPFTVPTSVGTGPLYVFKVSGVDLATGNTVTLPRSSLFSITNPYAGTIDHPSSRDIWYTGQNVRIEFSLGNAFTISGASTLRVEMASSDYSEVYTVLASSPITAAMLSGAPATIFFNVPSSFKKATSYFVRLSPNDGTFGKAPSSKPGLLSSTLSLPSPAFTIFASGGALQNSYLTINVTTADQTVPQPQSQPIETYAGSLLKFSWNYAWKPPVLLWNIDLYSVGESSASFTGTNLVENIANSKENAFEWTIGDSIPSGAYYVRIWGISQGASSEGTAPISAVSVVFTVTNSATQPALKFSALAANPWNAGCRANVTWTITTQAGSVPLNGWVIDLLRNSLPYKLVQTLTPDPLPSITQWTLVRIPEDLVISNDYYIRVRAILDTSSYPNQDVGSLTPFFKVLAPPTDRRTLNTTCIAQFPGTPRVTVTAKSVSTTARSGANRTRTSVKLEGNSNPNPFGNPSSARSLIEGLGWFLVCVLGGLVSV
ncbi:hypothetical protein BJ741DRAFT_611598 [Chytriomyces cf. hyalinus JEL632]|nr:hypothetical protein BJ741DRAFT_611598 [Chytriomyces cf. hyalinus JEL632]